MKIIGLFCIVGYILVTMLCLTYWCTPINEYWRVPVKYCMRPCSRSLLSRTLDR